MSQLQRSFAKAKLSGLPFDPPLSPIQLEEQEDQEDQEDKDELNNLKSSSDPAQDDDSSSASSASSASSTGTITPSPSKHLFARPKGAVRKTLDPIPWNDYFDQDFYLRNTRCTQAITHHVYLLSPAPKGPLFVTHHGAGSSGLSFALFASEMRRALPSAGILSLDAREHGETVVDADEGTACKASMDLSLGLLTQDLLDVIHLTQRKLEWPALPGLILVGHSLGGAVVTDLAASGKLGSAILGYAVLDVVEGSAIDALQSMQSYLSTRPTTFPSIPSGIEWHTRSRTIRNTTSARISVPALLRQSVLEPSTESTESIPPTRRLLASASSSWVWRTNLAATQPYWEGWFQGLSRKFLDAKGGKLLLLAGTDRLDKDLMIGQMQGKYQLQVFPDAGHFIHEDAAEKTAMVLADFYKRNDRSALVLPPKVGAMHKQ